MTATAHQILDNPAFFILLIIALAVLLSSQEIRQRRADTATLRPTTPWPTYLNPGEKVYYLDGRVLNQDHIPFTTWNADEDLP